MQVIKKVAGTDICFVGQDLEKGPLPAFFYFSILGFDSLNLPPYNSPVQYFEGTNCRIFSFDLPFHEDKFQAMEAWAEHMRKGESVIEDFLDITSAQINWMIGERWIDPTKMVSGGLSRGGFIATHLAAREKRISHVLGFAPITRLKEVQAFKDLDTSALDLTQLELTHLQGLRFYIGNRDQTVSTDACYEFIRNLAEKAHEKRARNCLVELRITPSIGLGGHGTSPEIFEEGALWLRNKI